MEEGNDIKLSKNTHSLEVNEYDKDGNWIKQTVFSGSALTDMKVLNIKKRNI